MSTRLLSLAILIICLSFLWGLYLCNSWSPRFRRALDLFTMTLTDCPTGTLIRAREFAASYMILLLCLGQ